MEVQLELDLHNVFRKLVSEGDPNIPQTGQIS